MEGDVRQGPSAKGPKDAGPYDKGPRADDDLVRAARKGELAAFDRLVERYQRQATAVAYRLLNNLDDAMEIVQDAFLNAYGKLGSLSDEARFGPWLLRIVSNLALNRRRSRMLRRTASLETVESETEDRSEISIPDSSAVDPQAAASAKDVERLIDQAMDDLPELQRQALVLFSIEKMPQKEVADILGCSVEAVKWHVFTARKKLKDKLKDYL
ncbi:MAG: RNA polymerase sigma factor [Phycisphaerae bacterium]